MSFEKYSQHVQDIRVNSNTLLRCFLSTQCSCRNCLNQIDLEEEYFVPVHVLFSDTKWLSYSRLGHSLCVQIDYNKALFQPGWTSFQAICCIILQLSNWPTEISSCPNRHHPVESAASFNIHSVSVRSCWSSSTVMRLLDILNRTPIMAVCVKTA
jgi:hypothetical protein